MAADVRGLLALYALARARRQRRCSPASRYPALWLMPVGWNLAQIAGSDDPGTMLAAAGVGWWTAALVALATVTTNFVNIYLSSLAWRTLSPRSTGAGSVWTIGIIGTAARPGVVRMADAVRRT